MQGIAGRGAGAQGQKESHEKESRSEHGQEEDHKEKDRKESQEKEDYEEKKAIIHLFQFLKQDILSQLNSPKRLLKRLVDFLMFEVFFSYVFFKLKTQI